VASVFRVEKYTVKGNFQDMLLQEPASCWFILRSSIYRPYGPPKLRLTSNELHNFIYPKTELPDKSVCQQHQLRDSYTRNKLFVDFFILMQAIRSSETSVLTRGTRRHIPKDDIPPTVHRYRLL
jgi:hypothetical protein